MKTIKLLTLSALFSFGISSCAPLTCDEANNQLTDAIEKWTSDPSETNCQSVRSALNELKNNSECPQAAKDFAQGLLNNTGC